MREHPLTDTVPVDGVAVTGPQLSVAVAVPSAESIAPAVGEQPKVSVVPVAVITGASVSTVQETVLDTVIEVLPYASVAVHDLV